MRAIHRTGGGFTLIELLVVIAIISILASMLMPTFSRAREQARKINCSSNLHQISTALRMYVDDHDGAYPEAWPFWASLMSLPTRPNLKDCIQTYVKNDDVWWCRSWEGRYGRNAWGSPNGGSIDFIVPSSTNNNEIIGVPPNGSTPGTMHGDAELQVPGSYPMLFCGSHWTRALNAHSGTSDSAFSNGSQNGGTNIAYGDGHVKYVIFNAGQWNQIYNISPATGQ